MNRISSAVASSLSECIPGSSSSSRQTRSNNDNTFGDILERGNMGALSHTGNEHEVRLGPGPQRRRSNRLLEVDPEMPVLEPQVYSFMPVEAYDTPGRSSLNLNNGTVTVPRSSTSNNRSIYSPLSMEPQTYGRSRSRRNSNADRFQFMEADFDFDVDVSVEHYSSPSPREVTILLDNFVSLNR